MFDLFDWPRLSVVFWLMLIVGPMLYFVHLVVRCGWKGALRYQKRITKTYQPCIRYEVEGLEKSISLEALDQGQCYGLEFLSAGTKSHVVVTADALVQLRDLINCAIDEPDSTTDASAYTEFRGEDGNPYAAPLGDE